MMLSNDDKTSGYRSNHSGYIFNEVGYAERRRVEVDARDNIIAIGYAERQIANTLKMVEKIKTEL